MSSSLKRGLGSLAGTLTVSVVVSSGCSATPKGALMLSMSTDMQTPKDVDVVSVFVETDGVAKFDYLGRVLPDGTLLLPSTLALVQPENPNAQVHIRVTAFQTQGTQENARVLRDVLTTVPTARTALLRLPLDFLDDGSGQGVLPPQYVPEGVDSAPDGLTEFDPTMTIMSSCDPMQLCKAGSANCQTMVNGVCAGAVVDSSTLPTYADGLVFGDGGTVASPTCFDVEGCFAGATPIAGVGGGVCSFALPGSAMGSVGAASSDGGGGGSSAGSFSDAAVASQLVTLASSSSSGSPPTLNFALVTPSTGACLASSGCYVPLPNDPNEGWTLQGNTVLLAQGVCDKLGSTVTLAMSSGCTTDTTSEPVCEPTGADAGEPPVDATTQPDASPQGGLADASTDATGTCTDGACSGTTTGTSNPSCAPGGAGMTNCGSASENCCTSLEVMGGTFDRTYDPTAADGGIELAEDGGPTGEADPATVTGFQLDKYLVTVGRFRQFVNAWNGGAGYTPPTGSGIHTHLNQGQGLVVAGAAPDGGGVEYETGWNAAAWSSQIAPTDTNLASCGAISTWTTAAGTQENLPINCVSWYEAYAFCIWDGGFLPSTAEWEYAAAGGSQQRGFPWGSTDPGMGTEYAIHGCYYGGAGGNCSNETVAIVAPVGTATLGVGQWGQLDMAGDVVEWTLDYQATLTEPCADCAYLTPGLYRLVRGGQADS